MAEITQDQKEAFVSMCFGGLVDRTLYEHGMPDWLRAAPSKILAIRANLDESPILFGLSGWLTNTKAVECSKCAITIEPNSTLYVGHDWQPRCEACEAVKVEQGKQRDAVYRQRKHQDMVRRSAAAKERWRERNPPNPNQLELLKGNG